MAAAPFRCRSRRRSHGSGPRGLARARFAERGWAGRDLSSPFTARLVWTAADPSLPLDCSPATAASGSVSHEPRSRCSFPGPALMGRALFLAAGSALHCRHGACPCGRDVGCGSRGDRGYRRAGFRRDAGRSLHQVARQGSHCAGAAGGDVLAHVMCGLTLTEVGLLFGRDRTTVAHACAVVEDRRDDPVFDRALDLLEWALPSLHQSRAALCAGDFVSQSQSKRAKGRTAKLEQARGSGYRYRRKPDRMALPATRQGRAAAHLARRIRGRRAASRRFLLRPDDAARDLELGCAHIGSPSGRRGAPGVGLRICRTTSSQPASGCGVRSRPWGPSYRACSSTSAVISRGSR